MSYIICRQVSPETEYAILYCFTYIKERNYILYDMFDKHRADLGNAFRETESQKFSPNDENVPAERMEGLLDNVVDFLEDMFSKKEQVYLEMTGHGDDGIAWHGHMGFGVIPD